MTIIRAPREERFTTLNRTIINDERLSYRALGLLVFLLDKPDNWRVEAAQLSHGRDEGRDAVRTALTELADAGYLVRQRRQIDNGQWVTETFLYETPGRTEDGKPGVGQPDVGAPGVGAPGVITKTETKTVNELRKTSSSSAADETFEAWWKLYPKKKGGKGEARVKWRKMPVAERLAAMLMIPTHAAWWAEHHTELRFIPDGVVWLNKRRWEDDQPKARDLEPMPHGGRGAFLDVYREMSLTENEDGDNTTMIEIVK